MQKQWITARVCCSIYQPVEYAQISHTISVGYGSVLSFLFLDLLFAFRPIVFLSSKKEHEVRCINYLFTWQIFARTEHRDDDAWTTLFVGKVRKRQFLPLFFLAAVHFHVMPHRIVSRQTSTRASIQTTFVQRHKTTKTALQTRVLFRSKSARINKQNGLWLIHTFSRALDDFNCEVMFRPTCTDARGPSVAAKNWGNFVLCRWNRRYANEAVCSNMTVVEFETASTDRSFGKWCFAVKVPEADAFVTTCVSVSFGWWNERLIRIGEWRSFEWFWDDIPMLKRYCIQFRSFYTVKKVDVPAWVLS